MREMRATPSYRIVPLLLSVSSACYENVTANALHIQAARQAVVPFRRSHSCPAKGLPHLVAQSVGKSSFRASEDFPRLRGRTGHYPWHSVPLAGTCLFLALNRPKKKGSIFQLVTFVVTMRGRLAPTLVDRRCIYVARAMPGVGCAA